MMQKYQDAVTYVHGNPELPTSTLGVLKTVTDLPVHESFYFQHIWEELLSIFPDTSPTFVDGAVYLEISGKVSPVDMTVFRRPSIVQKDDKVVYIQTHGYDFAFGPSGSVETVKEMLLDHVDKDRGLCIVEPNGGSRAEVKTEGADIVNAGIYGIDDFVEGYYGHFIDVADYDSLISRRTVLRKNIDRLISQQRYEDAIQSRDEITEIDAQLPPEIRELFK